MIGETLAERYKVISEIGSGGMGTVYEARHTGTGRRVAVKVLTSEFAKNENLVSRFYREARAAGAIEAQHIVQVLDTGTDTATGMPFMVMEYLDGEDLSSLFERLGPLPPQLALRITAQACLGLMRAHEARVVHRDIKPGNLFLTKREGEPCIVKVLDFGIAKIRPDEVSQVDTGGLTRTGSMLGSPLYMSPEQARGQKNIDHRSDIWSMGVVLYQALTGTRPHEDVEALGDLIIAICSELPAPIQDLAPWVPAEAASIAHRALHFDPADRFQTAAEMLEAIDKLLPEGRAIDVSMLVGVSEEERNTVAPRAPDAPAATQSVVRPIDPSSLGKDSDPTLADAPSPAAVRSIPPPPYEPAPFVPGASAASVAAATPSVPPPDARASEPGRSSRTPTTKRKPKPKPRSSLPILFGAGALIAFAIVGVYVMRERSLEQQVMPAPPAATTAPTAVPTPAATPTTTVDPSLRTVEVTIEPPTATVEVNGTAAKIQGGVLSISGTLGSVHRVHVADGKRQIDVDVAVAQSGAVPAKIELDRGK